MSDKHTNEQDPGFNNFINNMINNVGNDQLMKQAGMFAAGGNIAGGLWDKVIDDKHTRTDKAGSGLLKGAGTGAAIGSVVPGIGTAIGAGVGALAGGISGWMKGNTEKKRRAKIESANKKRMEHLKNHFYKNQINYDPYGIGTPVI